MVRNVLLVTVDSLRTDAFPLLADPDDRPAVAALVEDGTRFRRAFATGPGTSPSFPALLSGTLPLSYDGLGPLSDDRPRLAADLRDAGLATGGFQCNPFLSRFFDYDRGFDRFEDYQHPLMGVATRVFPRGIELNNPRLRRVDEVLHLTDLLKRAYQLVAGKPRPYVSADVVTDDAIDWLDGTDGPFFCWTHYMDVHHPCHPPAGYREAFGVGDVDQRTVADWYGALLDAPGTLSDDDLEALRGLYDAAVAYAGDQVARLVAHLRETGRLDETLVVLTSDHGELFGEHGGYGKPERMYDELLGVPLVVANGPAHLEAAADDLVSLLEVPPLVHDALDRRVPDAYAGLRPGVDPPRDHVLAEHEVEGDVVVAARSSDWLYAVDEIRGERRLFDLRDGGFEPSPPGQCPDDLAAAVEERLAALEVSATDVATAVGDGTADRLRDLGYL